MRKLIVMVLVALLLAVLALPASSRRPATASELQSQYDQNLDSIEKQISDIEEVSEELEGLAGELEKIKTRLNINRGVRGRWLLDGEAGKAIVESAARANSSIIIMARMFDVHSGPLMKKLAETLVSRAREGTEVKIILSKKFPIEYFHKVNKQAADYFRSTPVQLEMVEFSGRFTRELDYDPHQSTRPYVNSAVLLVDGVELIGGTYILSHDDLVSGQSNIIQLRGLGVYEEVRSSIRAVFDQLEVEWKVTPEEVYGALNDYRVDWAPVWDFKFYLGVYSPPVLADLYEKACCSIRLLTHRPSRSNSRVVSRALTPLVQKAEKVCEKEIFYQERGMGRDWLHVTDLLLDVGYDVHKFDNADTQYHRAGLVDDYWFYTGTVELSLPYLHGWNLQSLVSGGSLELGKQLKSWVDEQRRRAVPVHEKTERFSLSTPVGELQPAQSGARKFLRSRVIPAVKAADVEAIAELLAEESAGSVARRFLIWIADSDKLGPGSYSSSFQKLGVDLESPWIGPSENPNGRKLFEFVAEKLIVDHPVARKIMEENFIDHLGRLLADKQQLELVDEPDGFRLHQPELLPIDPGFRRSFRIKKVDGEWQLQLLE